jgi:hypothetical protein
MGTTYQPIHPKAIRALTCPQYLNVLSVEQLSPPPTDSVKAADAVNQKTHVTNKLMIQNYQKIQT